MTNKTRGAYLATLTQIDTEIQKKKIELSKLNIKRAEEVLNLRKKGFTYQKIADAYGVSRQAIHQLINPKFKTIIKSEEENKKK